MKTSGTRIPVVLFCIFFIFTACGDNSVGTGVSNPPTSTTTKSAAAAISSLFTSEDSESSVNANLVLIRAVEQAPDGGQQGCPEDDPACTCQSDIQNGGPENVSTLLYGDAGTFGSANLPVTLTEGEYCELEDGTENSGNGPDDNGRFASFTLIGSVDVSCSGDNSTVTMQAGSSGVWRNTVADGSTEAHQPEVYGNFIFDVDGTDVSVGCTIYMDGNEQIIFSDCSDENGDTIEQETEESCSAQ